MYGTLEGYADDLRARYSAIAMTVGKLYEALNSELGEDAPRKEKALWIRQQERSLRPVLSGSDCSRTVWREIKPTAIVVAPPITKGPESLDAGPPRHDRSM